MLGTSAPKPLQKNENTHEKYLGECLASPIECSQISGLGYPSPLGTSMPTMLELNGNMRSKQRWLIDLLLFLSLLFITSSWIVLKVHVVNVIDEKGEQVLSIQTFIPMA